MNLPGGKALAVLAIGSVFLAGCGGGSGGGGGGSTPCDDFDCQGMVNNLAANVMQPTFDEFENRAMALEDAVAAYQDDPTIAENKTAARDAWKEAMAVWQRAEVMQVGPLVDNTGLLRDTIYSWPSTNSCQVDQEVVAAEDAGTSFDITESSFRARGLDALGYLLFDEPLDHDCAPSLLPDWDGRPAAEREQLRANYAELVAGEVENQATTLVADWQDFLVELAQPGSADSRFDSVEEAVNAISDALFYLEKQTNDTKLAEPPGFKANTCGNEGMVCPDDVESPFARVSRENIIDNIEGFRLLFLGRAPDGTDGLGFSEFLAAQSSEGGNVAQTMINDLDGAQMTLEGVTMSLFDAVQDDDALAKLQVAFDELSEVNKQLKDQFLRILGLTIPDAAAGDGD